ncbi:MAG: hypothetical protein NTW69_08005 [Chloroflexi bacterium]|nr:hypothetical protein [Chloroflexota bacterium]
MTGKISKTKKQTKPAENTASRPNRSAQIMFAIFAIILILSMVLSAVSKF